jgi:hypothetical protein
MLKTSKREAYRRYIQSTVSRTTAATFRNISPIMKGSKYLLSSSPGSSMLEMRALRIEILVHRQILGELFWI